MSKKFLTPINLASLSTNPSTGISSGAFFYDSVLNKLKTYDGSNWKEVGVRTDTSTNWGSLNPVIYPGELAIETDTGKIKLGPSSATNWNAISTYINIVPSDLNTTLSDYLLITDIGAQGGVVGLNNDKNAIIPGSSIIIEGTTDNNFETTLFVTDPTEDRTITFQNASGTVAFLTDITGPSAITSTISTNTANTIDTTSVSSFTTIQYLVSIKQGSKIRSSALIVQTDGTSVDYVEYGIIETGGAMSGIAVEGVLSSTDALLQVTITNASTTNATVKAQKVLL